MKGGVGLNALGCHDGRVFDLCVHLNVYSCSYRLSKALFTITAACSVSTEMLHPEDTEVLSVVQSGTRWMLGLFEAGLFPGVNYYLSWYVSTSMLCHRS